MAGKTLRPSKGQWAVSRWTPAGAGHLPLVLTPTPTHSPLSIRMSAQLRLGAAGLTHLHRRGNRGLRDTWLKRGLNAAQAPPPPALEAGILKCALPSSRHACAARSLGPPGACFLLEIQSRRPPGSLGPNPHLARAGCAHSGLSPTPGSSGPSMWGQRHKLSQSVRRMGTSSGPLVAPRRVRSSQCPALLQPQELRARPCPIPPPSGGLAACVGPGPSPQRGRVPCLVFRGTL